jgi:hypothetical protein
MIRIATSRVANTSTARGIASEQEFQRKLNLPGRTRISCLEASITDYPKRCAAGLCNPAGLAEVRMVEEVKELSTKLHSRGFSDLGVLHNGKIRVVETRPDDYITTEIPKVE